MKPIVKIGSLLLAVVMAFSVFATSGCSLNKEWSYKTSDDELPIGVYIYALYSSYNQALNYAKELDDYDGTKDSWLDMEITDDDDNKQVAREWIKEKAETLCLSILAVKDQLKKEGASVDEATLASAKDTATTYWNVGPYAAYNYIMPMKDTYEPYGISFESFALAYAEYGVYAQKLFDTIYKEGGSQEVKDSELVKYFKENYVNYRYISVNLYESTTDESGNSKNVALSDKEVKKLTDEFDAYAKDVNGGTGFDEIVSKYMKANNIEEAPDKSNIEPLESFSLGEGDLKDALEKLDSKKAATVKVGDGDDAIYYIIYKNDIKDGAEDYVAANRDSVLTNAKQDDFSDYVEELAKNLKHEKNSAVDSYDPKMFFVAEEPTTAEATTEADESSEESDS